VYEHVTYSFVSSVCIFTNLNGHNEQCSKSVQIQRFEQLDYEIVHTVKSGAVIL